MVVLSAGKASHSTFEHAAAAERASQELWIDPLERGRVADDGQLPPGRLGQGGGPPGEVLNGDVIQRLGQQDLADEQIQPEEHEQHRGRDPPVDAAPPGRLQRIPPRRGRLVLGARRRVRIGSR